METIFNKPAWFQIFKEPLLRVKLGDNKVGLSVSQEAISMYGRWINKFLKKKKTFGL